MRSTNRRRSAVVGCVLLVLAVGGLALAWLAADLPRLTGLPGGAGAVLAPADGDAASPGPQDSSEPLALTHVGGQEQLDLCDGGWTLMEELKIDGAPPLWAQHDYCGGAQILDWELGRSVQVEGSRLAWEVSDIRRVPVDSTMAETIGMKGSLVLQTCYPDDGGYRLVALDVTR